MLTRHGQLGEAGRDPWQLTLRHATRRVLRKGKYLTGDRPWLLPLNILLTPEGTSRRITPDTDIVIEGFPRSGNTFAVFAFRAAQGADVSVASHIHHLAPLKIARKRELPLLVAVREPVPCLASYLVAGPHATPRGVLREYLHHHRGVLRLVDGMVVATFDQITTDLSSVIARVNERFETSFAPFEHTDESEAAVFTAINEYHGDVHNQKDPTRVVPRPVAQRRLEAAAWREQLEAPELAGLRAEADELYSELAGLASD